MNAKKAKKLRIAMREAGLQPGSAPTPLPRPVYKKLAKPLFTGHSDSPVLGVVVSLPLSTSLDRKEYKKAKRLYASIMVK